MFLYESEASISLNRVLFNQDNPVVKLNSRNLGFISHLPGCIQNILDILYLSNKLYQV